MTKIIHKRSKVFNNDHKVYYIDPAYLCGINMLKTFTRSSLKKEDVTCKRCLKKIKAK